MGRPLKKGASAALADVLQGLSVGRPLKKGASAALADIAFLQGLSYDRKPRVKTRRGGGPDETLWWTAAEFGGALDCAMRAWMANSNIGALYDAVQYCIQRDKKNRGIIPSREQAASDSVKFRETGERPNRPDTRRPDDEVPIPRWVLMGALRIVGETLSTHRAKGRGRHARWRQQYIQDWVDYDRWGQVEALHRNQDAAYGLCFEWLSDLAEGTAIAGSPDKIRGSWLRVRKTMKRDPDHYYLCRFVHVPLGPSEIL